MGDLKKTTTKGLFWSSIDSFGIYFIKFGFSIAIARILTPSDFGLIGMISIFIGVATWLSTGGFIDALVQRKEVNQIDYSTAFYFNIVTAFILFIILFYSSNFIARFYDEPRLVNLVRVISLNFVIGSFSMVPLAILITKLNFKIQAKANFISAIFSGIIALIVAHNGFGVWALVIQTVFSTIIRTFALCFQIKWIPSFVFSWISFKEMFKFGYKIMIQGLIDSIFTNIYAPIIGKRFSTGQLGFYTRAKRFHTLFVRQISIVFSKVAFPAFSSIQDEEEKFRLAYLKALGLMGFVIFPFITFLILSAKPLILLLLSEKWEASIIFAKLLYVEGFLFPFYILNLNLFNTKGRSDIFLKVDLFKKSLILASIFFTYRIGITGLIIGYLMSSFIATILSYYLVRRKFSITLLEQIKCLYPVILLSGIIYLLGISVTNQIHCALWRILADLSICSLLYYYTSKFLKLYVYEDFKSILEQFVPKQILRVL